MEKYGIKGHGDKSRGSQKPQRRKRWEIAFSCSISPYLPFNGKEKMFLMGKCFTQLHGDEMTTASAHRCVHGRRFCSMLLCGTIAVPLGGATFTWQSESHLFAFLSTHQHP